MARKAKTYRGARRRQARALARFMLSDWQINGGKERPTFRAIWPAFMLDDTGAPVQEPKPYQRGYHLPGIGGLVARGKAMIARHMRAA